MLDKNAKRYYKTEAYPILTWTNSTFSALSLRVFGENVTQASKKTVQRAQEQPPTAPDAVDAASKIEEDEDFGMELEPSE